MVAPETLGVLAVAGAASLFTAWTIGAGSSGSTPFAPAVGANALPTMRAAFVVGILGFLGAVLQGANVTETVGGELIRGVTLGPVAATVALTTAAVMIGVGVFTGYPIATAFAVSGSVVGVGLALGGDPATAEYVEIAGFWLVTPVVGVPLAYGIAGLLRSERVPDRTTVPALAAVVGAVIANMGFSLLGRAGEAASLTTVVARALDGTVPFEAGAGAATVAAAAAAWLVARRAVAEDAASAERRFLLFLGGLVAFSAGGGKVGLAVGPLLPLVDSVVGRVPLLPVLAFGGVGLLAGSWMAASRMIKALSQDYSDLGPRRSIAALVPAFVIAQVGIFLGVPMSFNEIFISTIAGSGLAAGGDTVSTSKLGYTALAWLASLFGGAAVSYLGYLAVTRLL
ncbi:MAG: anion permease [Haloferacaceae archaeon]